MQFFQMIALTGITIWLGSAQFARAEEWRTITPDVIYGHKAGMALTYDVIQPVKNAKGVGILFMMSGGWVSQWGPPKTSCVRNSSLRISSRRLLIMAIR